MKELKYSLYRPAGERDVGTHIARVDDIRPAPFGNTLYLTLSGGEKITLFAPWMLRCSADIFVRELSAGVSIQLVIEKYPGMDFFYAKTVSKPIDPAFGRYIVVVWEPFPFVPKCPFLAQNAEAPEKFVPFWHRGRMRECTCP